MTECPVCGLTGGFHDRAVHGALIIPAELLKQPGWYLKRDA